MTLTVDFYITEYNVILDTKGRATEQFKLKEKRLKRTLHEIGQEVPIYLPSTQLEVLAVIAKLKTS